MTTYFKHIAILLIIILTSCTDVIDVDVPVAPPRLVIEASLDWEKSGFGNEQVVKLSQSTAFFDTNTLSPVTGAFVKVTNDTSNVEFIFEDQNDGTYTVLTFVPIIDQSYTLEVNYNGETYIAQETLTSVSDINSIYQSTTEGFDDEVLEVNVLFDDPADIENFYLFRFQERGDLLPELLDIPDEFTNGNEMRVFYEKEEGTDINQKEFETGDVVDINFYGISERYFNYIRLLIEQYGSFEDPFSSAPVPLRGNCTNPTNPDNYAFGYFRLTQVVETSYTFL